MPFDFDTVVAPFRMQPGLRRLAPGARQSTPIEPGSLHFAEKLEALRRHASQALLCTPGFNARPALHALIEQAAADNPTAFKWDGHGCLQALRLGWSLRGAELDGDGPPEVGAVLGALPTSWRLAGLLSLALAEDFAIVDGATGRIPWLAVCLPSRWAPEDKVGCHLAEVHGPVADNRLLVAATEHLIGLVTGTDRWERFVWSVGTERRLMQHPRHMPPPCWPAVTDPFEMANSAFFRTEHQTFIPLPQHRQAVFTIHVESAPLGDVIDSVDRAQRLHDAIASMSQKVLDYRGLAPARSRLLAWLATRAG